MESTTDQQRGRELEEQRRAQQKADHWEARLRERGSLASTARGQALFQEHAEHLSCAIGALLEELIEEPGRSGPHFAAWPLLLAATCRGPRSIAAIALSVVIDGLGQSRETTALARAIGTALQDEMRAGRVEATDRDLMRLIRTRCGPRALSQPLVLRAVRVDPSGWTAGDRAEVGGLLLEIVISHLDLLVLEPRGNRRLVRASDGARRLLAAGIQGLAPVARFPMVVEPRPWAGMTGGGHLSSSEPLVRTRRGLDLSHLTPQTMAPLLRAVNYLQQQELRVDPEMVQLQRQMWGGGVRGLFPVTRHPADVPPRPETRVGREMFIRYLQAKAAAQQDAREGAATRARIEQVLQQAQAVAGQPIWLAHCADFRGRIYTTNRFVTHQGPDHERALIEFAQGEPASEAHMERVWRAVPADLTACWDPRTIGPVEIAIACRGSKDPWQAAQAAICCARWVQDPSIPVGLPVRFDQCCSGAAIIAGLMRDGRLARLCNLTGDSRQDLYGHLAELLIDRLRSDLQLGTRREQALAEGWLALGISRATLKGPTMAALYGGSWIGLVDLLAIQLQEACPKRIAQWQRENVQPARYLARHLKTIFAEELRSVHQLDAWLRSTSQQVLRLGKHLEWTTPAGMLVRLGQAHDAHSPVVSLTAGTRRWRQVSDRAEEGELSARATNASLMPNVVHAFDGSFCQQMVNMAAERRVPLLTNHDCFATIPAHADWLHRNLLEQVQVVFRTDHLARMAAEIAGAAGLPGLSPPVTAGTLDPGRVGENPEHFR